jgi:hypothetical protein
MPLSQVKNYVQLKMLQLFILLQEANLASNIYKNKKFISDVWFHSYIHRTQSLHANRYQTPLNFPNENEKWIGCLILWLKLEGTASNFWLSYSLTEVRSNR